MSRDIEMKIKVAVCIGGLPRGNYQKNLENIYNIFGKDIGADFYFSYWKEREKPKITIPHKKLYAFNETYCVGEHYAKIDRKYWPRVIRLMDWRDNQLKKLENKQKVGTYQIINHAMFLKSIEEEYDVIIRTRYDCIVSDKFPWKDFIEESYNEKKAIGFMAPGKDYKWQYFHKPYRIPKEKAHDEWLEEDFLVDKRPPIIKDVTRDWHGFLLDHLIIHHKDNFDCNKVLELHKQNLLLGVEFGWWQTLSGGDDHDCVWGGAMVESYFDHAAYWDNFEDCKPYRNFLT